MKKETIEKRRQEIYQAAMKIFSRKGFDKATLDEIAEVLHLSKPALYLYFKNKEVLFFSMIEHNFKVLVDEKISAIIKMNITSKEKVEKLIIVYTDFFNANLDFFKIMHNADFQILNINKSETIQRFTSRLRLLKNMVSKIMQQCIKDGYLKKDDPDFYTISLVGIIKNNIFASFFIPYKGVTKDFPKRIFELFMKGAEK